MAARTLEFSKLVDEWRKNTRLRLGIWLMLGILLLYLSLLVLDRRKMIEQDYGRTAAQLGQIETLMKQSEWPGRADAARALCVQLEGRFWKAEGRGMALAAIQNWIYGQLSKVGIDDAHVTVEPAVNVQGIENVWQVALRVEGTFNAEKIIALLHDIESHPQVTDIDGLELLGGPEGRFTLVLKAYFLAGTA